MLRKILIGLAIAAMAAVPMGHAAESGYAPQISNEGGVKVTVTPPRIPDKAKTWDFQVTLETHTRGLGDDLVTSSLLIVDGKQHQPVSWEGAPPGGHHRKGLLRFKVISPQPQAMELQIHLAGDASPRKFKWLLK